MEMPEIYVRRRRRVHWVLVEESDQKEWIGMQERKRERREAMKVKARRRCVRRRYRVVDFVGRGRRAYRKSRESLRR